jgi:Protein of unknown function (DUF3710)
VIFSRGRGSTGRHTSGGRGGRHARGRRDRDGVGPGDDLAADGGLDERDGGASDPPFGPYDISTAPSDERARLDLGSLRIPALPDVEIHLQAGPEGEVQQVLLSHAGSRLQLAAFAAPRSEGIWDEVRANLVASLTSGGSRPQEVAGDYGLEVQARVKEGGGATVEVRHVGIDGPRWFVHGIFLGAAAGDPERAGPLREVLRGVVVNRGTHAMPVSEALPLRLPPEAVAQLTGNATPES